MEIEEEDEWTREEQKLYNHRWLDLIPAIIRQWNLDGKPSNCQDTMDCWLRLLQQLQEDSHGRAVL